VTRILPIPNRVTPDPCPCGGQAWLRKEIGGFTDFFFVRSDACGSEGHGRTKGPDAMTDWNNGERPVSASGPAC
jgi:hypothetical protein